MMGIFSPFSKESKTTYDTTNNYTDKSANTAEGAIAAGEGATINIENTSDDIALGALAANQNTSQAAFNFGDTALKANRDVNLASLDNSAKLSAFAINEIAGVNDIASRERIDTLETTNLALQSQQGTTNQLAKLASGALERSQTPDSQVTKTIIWAVAIIAGVFALAIGSSRKSTR